MQLVIRWLTIITLLMVSACTVLGDRESPAPTSTAGKSKQENLHSSLKGIEAMLNEGAYQKAQTELKLFIQHNPNHSTAKAYLNQLENSPFKLYSQHYFIYKIKTGDTLSELSEKHMGSRHHFVGLARYNNLKSPSSIRLGQQIKIPSDSVNDHQLKIITNVEKLRDNKELVTALHKLAEINIESSLSAKIIKLIERTIEDQYLTLKSPEQLNNFEHEIKDLKNKSVYQSAFSPNLSSRKNLRDLFDVKQLVSDKKNELALERLIVEGKNLKSFELYQELSAELAESLHRQAILYFRNHDLEDAIHLWDKVLLLTPNHNSAEQYRKRATQMNVKLRQVN